VSTTEQEINTYLEALSEEAESPQSLLRKAVELLGSEIALASSFSVEDVALIHMLVEIDPNARVFALDTGRLNDETYQVAEDIRVKYGINVRWYFPEKLKVQGLVRDKGLYSFRESVENRKECCAIRKVEPLGRALSSLKAWITGQRREQSVTRQTLEFVEIDSVNQLLKLNPIAAWTSNDVWDYVKRHEVPYNKLYDKGFTSIGCAPCTRAISAGEDERAGRWWWESPEHKECGLHFTEEDLKQADTGDKT
jgi:phosphoadenosine phosphosulfate reductase